MRKGHRRTQSATIAASSEMQMPVASHAQDPLQIMQLLQASDKKVKQKIVNFEILDQNLEQSKNYLNFGSTTIDKYNNCQSQNEKRTIPNLLCIPETNKSSQVSSQAGQNISICSKDEKVQVRKNKKKKRLAEQNDKRKSSNLFSSKRKRSHSLKRKI